MSPFNRSEKLHEWEITPASSQEGFLEITESDAEDFRCMDRGLLNLAQKKELLDGLNESEVYFFAGLELLIREQANSDEVIQHLFGAIGKGGITPASLKKLNFYTSYLPLAEFLASGESGDLDERAFLQALSDPQRTHELWQRLKKSPATRALLTKITLTGDGVRQYQAGGTLAFLDSIPEAPKERPTSGIRSRISQLLSFSARR